MKISLLIAAIILGIGALFVVPRQNEIKILATAWTELEDRAQALNVPTDPKVSFSTSRISAGRTPSIRTEMVDDLANELIAFWHKGKGGDEAGVEATQERIAEFSPEELRLLVKEISADTTINANNKPGLIHLLMMGVASENPAAALLISVEADKLKVNGSGYGFLIQIVLGKYAERDPVAAAQWLIDHREMIGEIDDFDKVCLIQSAARKDLGAALSLIDSLEPERDSGAFFGLAFGVNRENADVFLATIRNRITDPTQRKNALNGLEASNLMTNFENATTWLEKSDFTDDERKTIFANFSGFALRDQTGKWLDWIADQKKVEGFTPANTTENIIQRWTMENFAAAGEWINSQKESARKEIAVQTYARTLAEYEPAAAADWAATLPEGSERTRILEKIHVSLERKDPEAAAALAEKYGLPSGD